jgi:general stress protein 26
MVETRHDAEAQKKVLDLIDDIDVAMMVTMDEEGRFRSRPMRAARIDPDGVLWFFTRAESPKSGEVEEDERVLLAYSDPGSQTYVSIYGSAELVRDVAQQKRLWSEPLRTWFPGGPEDAEVALLKVTSSGAEYWDAPSSTLVHAYGWIKAVTTGEPPHAGDNDKVAFTAKRTG